MTEDVENCAKAKGRSARTYLVPLIKLSPDIARCPIACLKERDTRLLSLMLAYYRLHLSVPLYHSFAGADVEITNKLGGKNVLLDDLNYA